MPLNESFVERQVWELSQRLSELVKSVRDLTARMDALEAKLRVKGI